MPPSTRAAVHPGRRERGTKLPEPREAVAEVDERDVRGIDVAVLVRVVAEDLPRVPDDPGGFARALRLRPRPPARFLFAVLRRLRPARGERERGGDEDERRWRPKHVHIMRRIAARDPTVPGTRHLPRASLGRESAVPQRRKLVITGGKGVIGGLLTSRLETYEIESLDLPGFDVRTGDLEAAFGDAAAVIHLAWETTTDNADTERSNPENLWMTFRVYEAAAATGVRRLIMASSVHADCYRVWTGPGLLAPNQVPVPDTPYGAGKVFMEALGRYFAFHRGLEVICVRFGGVNADNVQPQERRERSVWLRHEDCVSLIRTCLDVAEVPGRFAVIYGVSDNPRRNVDLSNPFGWRPLARGRGRSSRRPAA